MNKMVVIDSNPGHAVASTESSEPIAIAIVGIGSRFPGGADSPDAYWKLLSSGADAIREVPKDRWNIDKFYSPDAGKPEKMYVRKGGFLRESIDTFDAAFFGISPREAVYMDPQQRLLLEVAWEAFEDAGIPPTDLAGSDTGVYVGGFTLDSLILQMSPLNRGIIGTHSATGASMTMLANRLSYSFDLRGPSVSVDTACSSSLVAVHLACQALWSGECSAALVGGANVMLRPEYPIVMSKGRFLAPDGYSKSFDARANGYARGEGVGIVVLKPLSAARRDGDHVYALIRGTGVNQDGRTEGVTVPNPEAQEALIRRVYAQSGVPFADVRYVEAHGTGTPVGDPIEASVLGRTIGAGRKGENACVIGSAKAAIGHLEAAAGVAGLIKASLCLHHGAIPPQANLLEPNPNIPFDELGIRLPRVLEPMPRDANPVYVGVNAFGYGGTNAHVILQEAPPRETSEVSGRDNGAQILGAQILTISARDPKALSALARAYAGLLSSPDAPALRDVCYSASMRRAHHEHRLAVVADKAEQAVTELDTFAEHGRSPSAISGRAPARSQRRPVFVFTGMGPQWWGMGRELLESEPVFHRAALAVDESFRAAAGWSILAELQAEKMASRMAETQIAQPANFLVQVALTELLKAWKIVPAAIVGHSVGEVSSAYVSGALDLDDAVRVSYHRSRLQQRAAGKGKMLATGLTFSQAEALLERWTEKVSIGAVNGSSDVTLSGDPDALAIIAQELTETQIFNRFLKVEVAYHSPQMDASKDEMRVALKDIRPKSPILPVYSTVTGGLFENAVFDAEYWCDNIREPVRFADAASAILADGHEAFLEVGPHPVLASSLRDALRRHDKQGVALTTLRREEPERSTLLLGLGGLYASGYDVGWSAVAGDGPRYVKLPTYAWQRETYWSETSASVADRIGQPDHPLLGMKVLSPTPTWEGELNRRIDPYLDDHVIDSVTVFPGAGYIEQGAAIHALFDGAETGMIEDIEFRRALVMPDGTEPVLRATFDEVLREYRIYTRQNDDGSAWTLHATGRISAAPPFAVSALALDEIKQRCEERIDAQPLYARLAAQGLQYGPWFQRIQRLWRRSGEVLAELEASSEQSGVEAPYLLHPTIVDAAIQALIVAPDGGAGDGRAYLPVSISRVSYRGRLNGRCWSYGRVTEHTKDIVAGDIVICDDRGAIIAEILNLRCQALTSSKTDPIERLKNRTYAMAWEEAAPQNIPGTAGRWLILSDEQSSGAQCASRLQAQGATEVVAVSLRDLSGSSQDPGRYFERILTEAGPCQGVVVLCGLGQPRADEAPSEGSAHVQFLHLAQALSSRTGEPAPSRLYVVTCGAQQVNGEQVAGLAQALVIGLARTVLSELPHLRCTLVDLDPADALQSLHELADELLSDNTETDVALRGSKRYVHRLTPLSRLESESVAKEEPTVTPAEAGAFRLEVGASGRFESLRFRQIRRRPPAPGEVEIGICAAALNFKDVLKVLGMLPPKALEATYHGTSLGMEAAGVVTAVGEGVGDFQVGDPVVASVRDSFSSHVTEAADRIFALRKLDGMSFEEAASLPVIFMTAYYALHELARLRKGETVLIHAAAGGVGLAAIQTAKWLGATIIATAGSEEKRNYIRSLGVDHVLNSRTLEFADQVMVLTGGRGVDVVLNSLSGEPFLKSLQITAPLGRFIEIGKRDIVENARMPMLPFNRNLSFTAIDIDRIMLEKPELVRRLLAEVWERFRAGDYKPTPVVAFPASEIAEAFRHMAQSKHTGKIVISFEDQDRLAVVPLEERNALLKSDASYLITGGLGGFGLEIARWMVREGARHLVLVGRSGAKTARAQDAVRELKDKGVSVTVIAADIAEESAVTMLLDEIARSGPVLRGIMHAAAVLDDALLVNLDETRLQRAIGPKAHGAWLLHKHTQDLPLDFFALFSSVSALLGNPGQGNYVAANVFLDSLAQHRRALGLPATSVNWGALSGVGMAAEGSDVADHLARIGINAIRPEEATAALAWALEHGAAQLAFMDVDWARWRQAFPVMAELPSLAYVAGAETAGQNSPAQQVRAELLAAEPKDRPEIAALMIAEIVAATMRLPAARIDPGERLSEMGIDSLMAVELQIGVNAKFGVEFPVLELIKGGSILGLGQALLARMKIDHAGVADG